MPQQIEYIKIKEKDNKVIETTVPIKKEGIYYLSGEENYYLISSGKKKDLQNPFVTKGIIGIGWDKIKLEDIKNLNKEELKEKVEQEYKYLRKFYSDEKGFKTYSSFTTNKLLKFVNEIKLGDIIVLKDRGSNQIYFGKIISEAMEYSEEDLYIDEVTGTCNKIRKVKWLKKVSRENISSELKLAFNSRHALSSIKIEKVKEEINRNIFSYFYRGENLHIVFKVTSTADISQESFKNFQDYISNLKLDCLNNNQNNIEDKLNIKANVQSPGPIEFFGNPEIVKYIFIAIGSNLGAYALIKTILKLEEPKKEDSEIDDGFSSGN